MTLTPESVLEYAEVLVRQAHSGGRTLDFSSESLATLDELFAISDAHFETTSESQRNIVIFYNGCYLGTVLAKRFNATWQLDENWFDAQLLVPAGEQVIQIKPFEKVWRRVLEGPDGNSLTAYFNGLSERVNLK
jgi:hypothetical protein